MHRHDRSRDVLTISELNKYLGVCVSSSEKIFIEDRLLVFNNVVNPFEELKENQI